MKLSKLKIRDVLPLNSKRIDEEVRLSTAVGLMKKNNLFALPVFKNDKFTGIVTLRSLIERNAPPHTKVKRLILKPPKINPEDSFVVGVKKVLRTGFGAATVFEEENFKGILSEYEIIEISSKGDELGDRKINEIISKPHILKENEDIGKARVLMREKNISRLPIVNENEELTGSLDLMDLIRTIQPKQKIGKGDFSGEKQPSYDVPVSAIMNDTPLTTKRDVNLKDLSRKMNKKQEYSAVIVKNEKPVGIVTSKDIMEVISSLEEKKGVYVQIAGMPDVTSFTKEKVYEAVNTTVRKIGRIYEDLEYLVLHIKSHQKNGRRKYSVRTRFMTPVGIFVSKSWAWELLDAVDEALEKLETQIMKDHNKRAEKKARGH